MTQLLVTSALFLIAGYLIYSGSKMSVKKEREDDEKIKKKWKEIKKIEDKERKVNQNKGE